MKSVNAFILAFLLSFQHLLAAPSITAVSGTASTGSTLTVSGSGLPSKSRSKMLYWADAQQGTLAPHSTLSFNTSFPATENMAVITDSNKRWGAGAFRSNVDYTSATRPATLRMDFSPSYGSRHFVSWWEKSDVDYTPRASNLSENWKFGVREWYNISSTRWPNRIFGHLSIDQTENQIRFGNENPTYSVTWGTDYGFPTTTWRKNTILVEEPSSLSASDGKYYVYRGSTLVESKTDAQYNNSTYQNLPNNIFIQHVIANANWPSGSNWWVSDIAIDDTWGRYEVCNAATYTGSSQCETVPYTSAGATSATLSLRNLPSGSKWLYAIDNSNVISSGYSLSGITPNPPPSITNIVPSNSPSDGGATITINGADFVSTPSVTVDGVAATGEAFISSTQITFVTPAGSPGTNADVVVSNPDSQTASLVDGLSYDPVTVLGGICPCISQ